MVGALDHVGAALETYMAHESHGGQAPAGAIALDLRRALQWFGAALIVSRVVRHASTPGG